MSGCIHGLSTSHSPVFLLNSCLDLFSAPALARRDPLSRSYRVSLPSSLTVIHPSASVYSTRPRVSVYGTGAPKICLAGFLGSMITCTIGLFRRTLHTVRFGSHGGFACHDQLLHPSTRHSVGARAFHFSVSTSQSSQVAEC